MSRDWLPCSRSPSGPASPWVPAASSAPLAPVSGEEAQAYPGVRKEFPDATTMLMPFPSAACLLIERCHDDGEPALTAGAPMLQVFKGAGLSDLVMVGTRYFGGVKLGIGGLTRAYSACARACLEQAELAEKEKRFKFNLAVGYEHLGAVLRYLEGCGGGIIGIEYGEQAAVTATLPHDRAEKARADFLELTRGQGCWKVLEEEVWVLREE